MPRKHKHPSQDGRPAAERPFVDREDFIAPVHSALKEPRRTKPLVLVYYGGAGIGKSRLRRELVRQMAADPGVVTATLDFDIPIYHQPETALLTLRNSICETYKVRFPSFDLAYAVHWQKTHEDTPLGDDLKPLLDPDSVLSQVLDDSGKLPLIGLVPRISKLVAGSLEPSTPRTLGPLLSDWWQKRGERELEDLPQMEPGAIVDRLPALWAADLKDFLSGDMTRIAAIRDRVPSEAHVPQRRAVLFIDSYEKLGGTEGSGHEAVDSGQKTDEWVRELVKQLPEVLWIVCGRQKLRWEEVDKDWGNVLSQHQLGSLPDQASRRFLSSCGITNEPIQDAIVKGSQGVPHYLDLAVDTIESSKSQVPGSRFEAGSQDELVKQFVRHLDQPEIDALQVLSAPRYWYYGLFENLMSEYETGYPVTAYDDLARFSFVKDGAAPGTRTMHELMREALQEAQSPELRKRVHLFLHELYAGQLKGLDAKNIADKHKAALTEAFYHGRQAMSAQELWAWLEAAAKVFSEAEQARVLAPLCREMTQALETELGPNHADVATALWRLAWELDCLAEYTEAEPLLRRALAIAETGQGPRHAHYWDFLLCLGRTLCWLASFDEAEVLYRRMVEALEEKPGRDAEMLVSALSNLAVVMMHQREYGEAEELSRQALAVSESELGPDHVRTAWALSELGFLLSELGHLAEAVSLRRRALAMNERRWGANHPMTAGTLANLASDLKRSGRYGEAEPLLRRALKLLEESLGPDIDRTALAANNLAALLLRTGRYAEAEPLFRRALATFERKAGPDHPYITRITCSLITTLAELGKHAEAEQVALSLVADKEKKRGPDHADTASALDAAGRVCRLQGRYAEAKSYLARALEIRTKVIGPEHPRTLMTLGWLAGAEKGQGNYAEAERLYRDTLEKQERVLGPEHPDVAETANALAGICSRDGRHAEAETLFRRALVIREKVLGQDHWVVAQTLEGLAKVCEQTGRSAEAQELSTRAKAIREQAQAKTQNH